MFCTQCGTDNKDDARFCRNCAAPLVRTAPQPAPPADPQPSAFPPSPGGYSSSGGYQPGQSVMPQQSYQGYQSGYAGYNPPMPQNASGRAIAAMILSILSLVTCLGPLLSVPGLILGKMEMNAIRDGRAPKAGETFAKVGFYAGLVVTILSVLGIILYVFAILAAIAGGGFN
jgi:hypothetical protein